MIEHRSHPVMKNIIRGGLRRFIAHQILQFEDAKQIPIHFVGSISHFLQDDIKEILTTEYQLNIGNVVKRPIDGLVNYHKKQLENSSQ